MDVILFDNWNNNAKVVSAAVSDCGFLITVSRPFFMRNPCSLLYLAMVGILLPAAFAGDTAGPWWRTEPVRFFQTNLPENHSTLDPVKLVDDVADFGANVLLLNMGGIAAQYPTDIELHFRSRWLPEGKDFFGESLREAHERGLRVIGRFDLSKTQKPVFDVHPEWFFRRVNGEPAIFNELYSACINGGYYWEHAPRILTEALTRYEVDGVFFNMFGNPARDYAGVPMGPCHCDACAEKFRAEYHRELPVDDNDPDYRAFMYDSAKAVAANLGALIHRLRPGAAFLTYIDEYTDIIVHESNTSVTRPLPLWSYSASDNVNRSLNSGQNKTVFNLCMSFVDYPWRFIHVSPDEIRSRLWQNLANGAPPALVIFGAIGEEDTTSLQAARPIFEWHQQHEDLYVGQRSAARVLLLYGSGGVEYRGFFRILTEAHIPFAVTTDQDWLTDGRRDAYDLVIAPEGAPSELDSWVERGGRLLVAGVNVPTAAKPDVVAVHEETRAAWRLQDHDLFPSLSSTELVILDSPYVELKPGATDRANAPVLTLIPPAMTGPPELVWLDKVETTVPGLWSGEIGRGRIVWLPWSPGGSYYHYSSPSHAGLVTDLIDRLLPHGRQLRTEAHPLVEITLMQQPKQHRTLVHLVNVSGHSNTGYHPPLATGPITVEMRGTLTHARAVKLDAELPVSPAGDHIRFTLPKLYDYEVVVLE